MVARSLVFAGMLKMPFCGKAISQEGIFCRAKHSF